MARHVEDVSQAAGTGHPVWLREPGSVIFTIA